MPQNTRECRRNCTGQNQNGANGATSLEDCRQHSPTHQPATRQKNIKNHRASGPRILQPSSGGRHLAHAGASGNRIQLYNSKCITEGSKAHRCQWLEKPGHALNHGATRIAELNLHQSASICHEKTTRCDRVKAGAFDAGNH